jgi:two-component system, OmpR family, response regulator
VFSREQLLRSVWEHAHVGSRTVDVHVRRLRVKLGAQARRLGTVRNVGYRIESSAVARFPRSLDTVA